MEDLEGKIQIQSDLVPDNDNPRQPVTSAQYIKGGAQTFGSVEEMVLFHPAKMKQGMSSRVVTIDVITQRVQVDEFILIADPETLVDTTNSSIITIDNFLKYWSKSTQTLSQSDRVFSYSPDGPNGTRPPYPYVDSPAFETNWHSIASSSDRWVRFRDDDNFVIASGVKIFTGWTLPVSIGQQNVTGDYIDNQYIRQDVDTTIRTSISGLVNNKFYLVIEGTVTETPTIGPVVEYSAGRVFQYKSAYTYVFAASSSARETVPAPERTVGGILNNNPSGFSDVPPLTSGQLWNIYAPKSVYGDLKGDWQIKKIDENPDLIRYNEFASPNPNEIVGNNNTASTGTQGDIDLNAVGWLAAYSSNFNFIAERKTTGTTPAYTQWEIKKISGESGEYIDRVFKLFDINADFDDVASDKPTSADAISQGYSDTPLQETDTQINWVFEAHKFLDGTLKGSWSNGTPYSGQDVLNDLITSDAGDNFKYNPNSATPNDPFPSQLTLTGQLYRGVNKVWEKSVVTYSWERIYNNGADDSVVISSHTNTDPLYLLPASGSFGSPGYFGDDQRLVVKPGGVSGKAIFRLTQTMVIPGGTNIDFVELYSVNDVTDGLDAKDLTLKADNQLVIYDNVGAAFAPSKVNLNCFFSNLVDPFIYWFKFDGGVWVEIDRDDVIAPAYVITDTPFGSRLTIDSATVFDADDDLEELRYAASTSPSPDTADSVTTFSDFITIAKASAAAVGTPGADALFGLMDNEYQNIILDDDTGVPFAGEIGGTGRAQSILSVFDGINKIPYGAGSGKFTISIASDNVNVAFSSNTTGLTNDVRIFVSTWAAGQRKAVATVSIDYDTGSGHRLFTKKFTVGSTLDTPGALSVIMDSDAGFEFYPSERGVSKNLTAKVYDSSKTPQLQNAADFYFNWTIGGSTDVGYTKGGGGTNGQLKIVSRAQILLSAFVTVRISKVAAPTTNDIVRSVSVRITDIADAKLYRLFSDQVSAPVKPISTVSPAGAGLWQPFFSAPKWAVDGYENPGSSPSTYTWTNPYAISGEQGDQGQSGGTEITLYRSTVSSGSVPPFGVNGNLSTIAQMVTGGWRSGNPGQFPISGYIWKTTRLYKTLKASNSPLTFDINGYPEDAVVFDANSVWGVPIRLTPLPASPGATGAQGPGYNGITFIGTDGSGNNLYSLNAVGGAAPASFSAPKGATGAQGSTSGLNQLSIVAIDTFGGNFIIDSFKSMSSKINNWSSSHVIVFDTGNASNITTQYFVDFICSVVTPGNSSASVLAAGNSSNPSMATVVDQIWATSQMFISGQNQVSQLRCARKITTDKRYIYASWASGSGATLLDKNLLIYKL